MAVVASVRKTNPRRRSELGLLLMGMLVVLFAYILAFLGVYGNLPADLAEITIVIVATGLIVNMANRILAPEADPVLIPVILVLNGLGYVLMMRLEAYETRAVPRLAGAFAIYSLVGVAVYITVLAVIKRSRDLERYRYMILLLAAFLLVLPLIPHVGYSINGARLWVAFGRISFQPVEFAKILLVVFFASYFVEKRELLSLRTNRVGNHMLPDLRGFGPVALAWVASLAVILLENDIGFSLLLFVIFLAMLWTATGRYSYLVIGLIAFIVAAFLSAKILPQIDYHLHLWVNPWPYVSGAGGQSVSAEYFMAQGGLTGTGLGLGTPWLIPVAEQDYAFSALAVELGLIGATAILVGYALVVGSGLRASIRARSDFSKLLAVGLTASLGFQAFIIMAVNIRLLPETGITLPFVSYGGSSLVANFILIALIMRVSQEGSENRVPAHTRERLSRRDRREAEAATAALPKARRPRKA
ncbi:MAG TPA: FtsW/RodA/SpoVE family cell cycle protein [Acidimicrobiales bacterium]|nr:FtsW/RodA/SpoVE family cell cycle protein [Acidimicrobiales bacterium]